MTSNPAHREPVEPIPAPRRHRLALAATATIALASTGCESMVNSANSFNEGAKSSVRSSNPEHEYHDEKGEAAQDALDDGDNHTP